MTTTVRMSSVPSAVAVAAVLLLSAAATVRRGAGQALVPGMMIFGDSVVDAGNNNRLPTLVRADFPPYGRDFPATHAPTGRFCNGKLATDYTGKRASEREREREPSESKYNLHLSSATGFFMLGSRMGGLINFA
jgi:hypothetical protein